MLGIEGLAQSPKSLLTMESRELEQKSHPIWNSEMHELLYEVELDHLLR